MSAVDKIMEGFPSPTGVNHYEFAQYLTVGKCSLSFRPQQGLIIMNYTELVEFIHELRNEFPSPTGVNHYEY